MERAPPYSHPPEDKQVLVDDKKLTVETNATLPQAVSRDEKAIYANSDTVYSPEVVRFEDTDKEVDHRSPEVVGIHSPLYHNPGGMRATEGGNGPEVYNRSDPEVDDRPKREGRRFCGLAKWPFIFVLMACVLVIAVALGAGLGATLPKKSQSAKVADNSAVSATPLSTPASNTPSATTSVPAATPSIKDFRDRVKYNLTMYEGIEYKGAWQYIDRAGYYVLGFNVSSYNWHCGAFTMTEMCSFAFCRGEEFLAWRGGEDRALGDIGTVLGGRLPNRVKIECGSTFGNPGCAAETYTATPTVYPTPPVPDSTSFTQRPR